MTIKVTNDHALSRRRRTRRECQKSRSLAHRFSFNGTPQQQQHHGSYGRTGVSGGCLLCVLVLEALFPAGILANRCARCSKGYSLFIC